ncbi:MAG: hypothetical protein RE471_08435 [Ferroplasma sp.]|uniref:hypothetical protein n=1 Tax=Ferroplasma sp. TaxID=2591003 RepID=UPI0028162412|nr:hypothetical protein [Ferroplasma sp.]WMT50994.1 MAG: hypothetical protein RE471_08435 [Ferroplasma sp.]
MPGRIWTGEDKYNTIMESFQNSNITIAEIGVSEGNWYNPWNIGAYAEIGAYSNRAYNFNGKLVYSGPPLYFPFLTSESKSSPEFAISLVLHQSVWPSVSPPW